VLAGSPSTQVLLSLSLPWFSTEGGFAGVQVLIGVRLSPHFTPRFPLLQGSILNQVLCVNQVLFDEGFSAEHGSIVAKVLTMTRFYDFCSGFS
jgi:hypothetical protein